MVEENPRFYVHPQTEALSTFPPILDPLLPFSNGLYNRLRAPHNTPSRRCLFAATFPPSNGKEPEIPAFYTILFADRSRHSESQIWMFNPLITLPAPLSPGHQSHLSRHLTAAIHFLKDIQIPDAPGWPFSPILKFACLHEYFSSTLKSIAEPKDALVRATYWNLWNISTSTKQRRPLPQGFTIGRVPEEQLDIVLATSTIVRQPSTMLLLPNVGILSEAGKLVAWGYIGIDGSFATLYVLEEYRGKGLATSVAVELMAEVLLLIYDLMVRRGGCILMLRRAMRGVRE
jgi:GNAT superfamily N-acetyltransferase